MTNITYWGDMLNWLINSDVAANYGHRKQLYTGPNGDGTLDSRITRGDGDRCMSGSDRTAHHSAP